MEAADHILIPFWNDQDAYEGVARSWKTAQQLGKTASGVLNFATPNSITHEITAAGVLKGIGSKWLLWLSIAMTSTGRQVQWRELPRT